jgi:hypothetical protein
LTDSCQQRESTHTTQERIPPSRVLHWASLPMSESSVVRTPTSEQPGRGRPGYKVSSGLYRIGKNCIKVNLREPFDGIVGSPKARRYPLAPRGTARF